MTPSRTDASFQVESTRLSADELERILSAHEAHVAHTREGVRAALSMCDLSGEQLSDRNLSGADLSGADLHGANVSFSKFIGALLYCADLRDVDGRLSNFTNADLRGAKLNGSNLSCAILDYADFRPGRLVRQLADGRQEYVDRSGSGANVDFSKVALHGATFESAQLQGASFRGAIIHATKFKNARISNTDFTGAILSEVNLEELHLPEAMLKTCVVAPPVKLAMATRYRLTVMLDAHQRWIDSDGRSEKPAVLDDEDLRPLGKKIANYKLTAISARQVIGVAVNFTCLELQGANFENADLRGAVFDGADLRGANFRGARLSHARFHNADLRPLELKSGQRMAVELSGADISDEQLAQATTA